MKLHFFTINALEPAEDQEQIDAFCQQHRIIAIDKHLIKRSDELCYWSVCVTYLDAPAASKKPAQAFNKRASVDYEEIFTKAEFAALLQLKDTRKSLADAEGVPVYSILTNAPNWPTWWQSASQALLSWQP